MGEKVSYRSNGGQAEGYLALPENGAHGAPGVLVIQEWWGLVPHIEDVAERWAAQGYVALAPDLYHGLAASEPDEAQKLMLGLAMDVAARDMAGAAAYLKSLGVGKVGAVGFCMGGSLALFSATVSPDVVATVGFYPAVPWERMNPTWSAYERKAAMIHADEGDGGAGAEGIQAAKAAIEGAGGEVSVFDYPHTEHAFFNDTRPDVYNREAAETAQRRTLDFFGHHLR